MTVTNRGLEVHYRIFGEGKPLLVLGGGPGDHSNRYVGLCELLAPVARCVLPDQRGTGDSTPAVLDATTINVQATLEDFEAIREALGLAQWSVLGFSYGGYLASLYAHFHPGSISSLVLLGSMGLNWDGSAQFEDNVTMRLRESDLELAAYWSTKERLKADYHGAVTEIVRAKMPGYFFDRQKSLATRAEVKAADFNFAMGDFIYKDTVDRGLDLAKLPPAYSGPALVVHGRQDPTGESVPLQLASLYKAQLVWVDKAGHYSWAEQPEAVKAAIGGFLSEKVPG